MQFNPILTVSGLYKDFMNHDGELNVLDNISFELEAGSLLSVVGPSGCGKTTLLEIIASLQSPTSGQVKINTSNIKNSHSDLTLFVFQQYNRSMLPFMTVRQNVQFVLESIPNLSSE